ncbi:MAG: DUF1983 domain-containing protein [Paucibacter sp.]|nr:DUF1983 domain-containing protein [Roseateles sp.]
MSDLPDVPGVPPKLDSQLRGLLQGIRDHIREMRGFGGNEFKRSITLREVTVGNNTTIVLPGSGGGGGAYVPDYTPPPTPTGVICGAGIDFISYETDPPTFTEGNGYGRTMAYGAKWPATDVVGPTFGTAVLIDEFVGEVGSRPTDPATRWCLWLKWKTRDGIESVDPAGGTNGFQVTTGQDVTKLLEILTGQITESQLFADLGERIDLIDGPDTLAGSVAARVKVEATTRASETGDLFAQYTVKLDVGGKVSGYGLASTGPTGTGSTFAIRADRFYVAAPSGVSGVADVVPFAVQATPYLSPSGELLPAGVYMTAAYIRDLDVALGRFQNAFITNAMIVSLSASRITSGVISVGNYIQSSNYVPGTSGWRIHGDGTGEFRGLHISGPSTFDGQVVMRNTDGSVMFQSGGQLPAAYVNPAAGWLNSNVGLPRGQALNANPECSLPSAWTGAGIDFLKNAGVPNGTAIGNSAGTGSGTFICTELIPYSSLRKYKVSATAFTSAPAGICYIGVAWYLASGAVVVSNVPNPAGWINGSFSYFGLAGSEPPGAPTVYSNEFGAAGAEVPAGVVSMRLIFLPNYDNHPTVRHYVTDFKIEDITDVVQAGKTADWSQVVNNDGNRPANGATVGATWGANLFSTPTNLAALSGSESINNSLLAPDIAAAAQTANWKSIASKPAFGALALADSVGWGGGTGKPAFNVFSTLSYLTESFATTYVAAGAFGLVHINTATIANLAALATYTGTLTVDADGFIRMGKTEFGVGSGLFAGNIGGEYGFDLGDASDFVRWRASTGWVEQRSNLVLSLTGTIGSLVGPNNSGMYPWSGNFAGSKTVSVTSGGSGSYSYRWSIVLTLSEEGGAIVINGSTNSASVGLKGSLPSASAVASATIYGVVTDLSNGKTSYISFSATVSSGV